MLAEGVKSRKEVKTVAKYWRADPVHMSPEGYEKLALGIVEDLPDLDFKRFCRIFRGGESLVRRQPAQQRC
jgi:hypothetical protein